MFFVAAPSDARCAPTARKALHGLAMLPCLALLLALLPAVAQAADSPVGLWQTINDETGLATSIVRIQEENGALVGKVQQVLQSSRGPNPLCEACKGARHNQPVVGMSILWDLKADAKTPGSYQGGFVLDPSKGKEYRARIKLREDGKLEVRGFIGIALLGRTQVWRRPPPAPAAPAPGAPAAAVP